MVEPIDPSREVGDCPPIRGDDSLRETEEHRCGVRACRSRRKLLHEAVERLVRVPVDGDDDVVGHDEDDLGGRDPASVRFLGSEEARGDEKHVAMAARLREQG